MGKLLLKLARRWTKIIVRTFLCLLLVGQLAVLWIVSHRTPTRLPPAVLSAVSEIFSGQLSFTCREATIDNRGRIRLGGARIVHDEHPGDVLYADLDFIPLWGKLLTGDLELQTMEARGRGTLGEQNDITACDDFVVRLERTQNTIKVQSAARVGLMVLRADASLPTSLLSPTQEDPMEGASGLPWDRVLAADCLKALRALEGSITLNMHGPNHATELLGVFIENPTSVSSLPLTVKRGTIQGRFDKTLHAQLHLQKLNVGNATAGEAWFFLDNQKIVRAYFTNIQADGLVSMDAQITGTWHDALKHTFALHLSTETSWVQANITADSEGVALSDSFAHIAASDLTRLNVVATGARNAGVDLSGPIDLIGAEFSWKKTAGVHGRGSFAFSKLGWKGISPSRVRPDNSFTVFTGDFNFSTNENKFSLQRLNLGGICGELEAGLQVGDAYTIRLNSTEGCPVNPPFLNNLLGDWWKDLWSRFDLSTAGMRPHADVLVKGKWGAADVEKVCVRAQLENFGFMGGRFSSLDLWVFKTPQNTTVRIDSVRGELEGRGAGSAHGAVEWDALKPEWNGQPRITVEGDIQPAFLLRLYDVSLANQLREWKFPKHQVRLALEPDHSLQIHLSAAEPVTVAGVRVESLEFDLAKNPSGTEMAIRASGGVYGGHTTVEFKGDMSHQNTLSVSVIDWSRTGLMNLVASIQGRSVDKQTSKDKSNLMVSYKGTLDLDAPLATEGEGHAVLTDPHLKTIHLLGGLSEGLDALGLGFSSYPLEKAELSLHCKAGVGEVKRLDLTGPSASLKFKGNISLRDGALALAGQFKVSPSPFGPLGLLNPNRLIASMINIYVGGNLSKPQVSLKKPTK